MIDVKMAFGLLVIMVAIVLLCAFIGMWLGAYIHHRGVSIGSGQRESFTGIAPTGDVFRVESADDLPDEPDVDSKMDATVAARAERFLSTMMDKGGV